MRSTVLRGCPYRDQVIIDAANFFEVQQDSEWQMARWKADTLGGMAIHHRRGYDPCTMYATHLMAVFNDSSIRLPKKVVGEAIERPGLRSSTI